MSRTCYIAAPYAGDVDENVRRACALGALAMREGRAPIVVHPAIAGGVYGRDEVPMERDGGRLATIAVQRMVQADGGELWVLLRDDGTMSPGTAAEVADWRALPGARAPRWFRWVDGEPVEVER